MEDFDYKLVMFGFSALREDLEEVHRRFSLYPNDRSDLENGDECFLINLKTKEIFHINLENENFFIKTT